MTGINPLRLFRKWISSSIGFSHGDEAFDPTVHLNYSAPRKKYTMQELSLKQAPTTSSIAGSTPFPLLSHEGVRAYRRALFRSDVLDQCASSPFPATLVLRDAGKHSRFIRDFWEHPETMRIVSEVAGVPLEVVMPAEIGHTNIQVEGDTVAEMASKLQVEPAVEKVDVSPEEREYDPLSDDAAVIPWHYDSYPYVCVLMLSETEGMIGGETYIKRGDRTAQKVEGPQIGHAVMLQGGEVQHLAARARGVKERITTITSYRSSMPACYDSSYMTNIRPYADLDCIYSEWTQYRLRKLRDEITQFLNKIETDPTLSLNQAGIDELITAQIRYIQRTSRQMVPVEYQRQLLSKYGKATYYNAPRIWEIVQSLPEFEHFASCADDDRCWMPRSVYWSDMQSSAEGIRLGESLESALGNFVWDKKRRYFMGDELLRQGLNEVFLDWLDSSGLWDIYCKAI
ncbi:hypothetical protein P170DRAFT_456552 [Aspergillus steynii IBT 23096]|uniref:Fe2OG dioxygenase domain-containing protein n=1 Tax=Aspergillus steynii IBT 23096 TaxID=1392250 RepID=A0A2I2G4J5_9EURO|nr:uncharacterized protein P170DRAFT_456552 [Aspergillus steynii IBT 23096]PLB47804.1 hypothetical protein P170DRAFT_456552 [Aspergillus steynii IBT 23096]